MTPVFNQTTTPPPSLITAPSSAAVKVESEADLDGGDIIEGARAVMDILAKLLANFLRACRLQCVSPIRKTHQSKRLPIFGLCSDSLDESGVTETVIPFPRWVVVPVADDDVV
jgi:hypothetical protein